MDKTLRPQELEHLYAWLLPEERDELLQCVLIAASRGGEAMVEVLEQLLLCHATEELLDDMGSGGQGHDNPIYGDLLELAREDEYDWAVDVSHDLLLIPVVRYLQSHGRKIIQGCFPPVAMDLTRECWASIDLRVL